MQAYLQSKMTLGTQILAFDRCYCSASCMVQSPGHLLSHLRNRNIRPGTCDVHGLGSLDGLVAAAISVLLHYFFQQARQDACLFQLSMSIQKRSPLILLVANVELVCHDCRVTRAKAHSPLISRPCWGMTLT